MNAAIILSGGTGSRMGSDIPKQYLDAGGKPVIAYCISALESSADIDRIVVVAAEEYRDLIRSLFSDKDKFFGFADPGDNRQLSILSGMNALKAVIKNDDNVIIHDAARPLITNKLISDIAETLKNSEAVLPVLPVKDTLYIVENGRVSGNLDRDKTGAGQAPEGFRFGPYLSAVERLLPDRILEISGSMQPAVMAGMDISCIPGDEMNFKITTPVDLARFKEIINTDESICT
jgi:2-C-methyl-D-erythritol 4-phosphate cytidylyltransferase